MRENVTNVELKEYYAFLEDGHLFLNLVYTYETTDGTHELHIPKVALRVTSDRLPGLATETSPGLFGSKEVDVYIDYPGHTYKLLKRSKKVTDKFGELVDCPAAHYIDCLVRENQVEMTIEEIEKQLGHKIKIVSKDK